MIDDHIRFDDLFRVFAALRPRDAEARAKIAALLGFALRDETPAEPAETKAKDTVERPAGKPRKESDSLPSPAGAPKREEPRVIPPTVADTATILKPVRRIAVTPPEWLSTVEPFPPPDASLPAPPPLEPLFLPRWTRGILAASTTVSVDAGAIDVGAVVAAITEGRPLRRVPRRPMTRMANGVQVLMDGSDSMLPFAADQEWLAERIATTAGRDRTEVLGIGGGSPFIAGSGPDFTWSDYFAHHLPARGVAVILVSDLGIGRVSFGQAATPGRWAAFAREVRRNECPLVAIVPYGPTRWPAVVRRAMPIEHWDRGTNARAARRVVGRSPRQRWAC